MQSSLIYNVFLPIALVVIMFGLGLSMRIEDFGRVVSRPKVVLAALACQIVLLPAICFGLIHVSTLPPAIMVGMMLLAASPAGPSGVLYTHLADGDTALSLTLTAVNSVVAMVTLPILVNLSLHYVYDAGQTVPLQIDKFLQVVLLALVPAFIGVIIQKRRSRVADRLERPVKFLATLFLAAVVIYALVTQWDMLLEWGPIVGLTALAFNVSSLLVGYSVPRILGFERRDATAITMTTGIHNAAFVITLALGENLLNNPEMAIPPAIYALIAYLTAAAAVWFIKRSAGTTKTSAPFA